MLEDYAYKKIKTKHNHYCLTQIPQFALLAALIWHQALLLALETPIPDLQFCLYHLYSCVSRIQLKVCGTLKKFFLINKTRSWFFESINKISKPLARLTKKKTEDPNTQNKKWKRRNNKKYHKNTKTIKEYYEQSYANKWENLEEMDKFLEHTAHQNWIKKK